MAGLSCGTLVMLVAGPIGLNAISWRFYFVIIIPPAVEFLCVYLFFPETKQRSLEDIAEIFGDKVAVHYYQRTEAEQAMYAEAELEMDEKRRSSLGTTEPGKEGRGDYLVEDVSRKA